MLIDEIIPFKQEGRNFEKKINHLETIILKERKFCFPRHPICISSKYIELMDLFGNMGGFEKLLNLLEEGVLSEKLSMSAISFMAVILALPFQLYHFDWLEEFGPKYINATTKKLFECKDTYFKKLEIEDIEQIEDSLAAINFSINTEEDATLKT